MKGNRPQRPDEQLNRLVKAVLSSSKHENVAEDLIKNIGSREIAKQKSLKLAIKATKNKLHQIGGAYFLKKPNYELWLQQLRNARQSADEDSFRKICVEVMGYHCSTRERLSYLSQFHKSIFSLLPPVHSIVDVACGFHPLSIPWMPLTGKIKYCAYDVYKDMIGFLSGFLMLIDNIHGFAEARDVLQQTPTTRADLAYVLNTIPCFEQLEKSAGLKILESINAGFLVVSFPAQTLGGRRKDMRRHYAARFKELTREKSWRVQRLDFAAELVFVVEKQL